MVLPKSEVKDLLGALQARGNTDVLRSGSTLVDTSRLSRSRRQQQAALLAVSPARSPASAPEPSIHSRNVLPLIPSERATLATAPLL
jgi:hypothetical protein